MNALPRHGPGQAVPDTAAAIEVDLVEGLDGLARLGGEWDALFERAAMPHQLFQRHALLMHWARHFGSRRDRLLVVAVRRRGRLVMAWPLVSRRRFGLTVLRLMGEPIAQFGDVLAAPGAGPQAIAAAWRAVDRLRFDILLLRNVRSDSVLKDALGTRRPVALRVARAPCVELDAAVGADGPGSRYSSKYRSNYRRRLRHLKEHGEVGFGEARGAEAGRLVEHAIALKGRTLARRRRRSPVNDPRFLSFFMSIARDCPRLCGLVVSSLKVKGKTVAADLSFDCKGRTFGYLTVHDPAFSRDGLGTILIHHVFAAAQRRGSRAFDMMAPADRYKLQHASSGVEVRDLALAGSLSGRAALAVWRIASGIRSIWSRRRKQPRKCIENGGETG
jgi:CelD/BcsL family acetyltransferase involved in cellulose biosynthesis